MTHRWQQALAMLGLLGLTACGNRAPTAPPPPPGLLTPPAIPTPVIPPGTPGSGAQGAGGQPVIVQVAVPPAVPKSVSAGALDVNGAPNFGEKLVGNVMYPDPTVVPVTSGGSVDVSAANLSGCAGHVSARPDFNLRLTEGAAFLRVFMTAAGGEDTTLVVNKPDGTWVCADDTYARDPGIDLEGAAPGVYNIWVGSYQAGTQAQGTLTLTESRGTIPSTQPVRGAVAGLNSAGTPNYGIHAVAVQPITIDVVSGGNVDVNAANPDPACRGHVTPQPDANVTVATPGPLGIFVDNAQGSADTTLVVQGPDGAFYCNDDTNGRDPSITLGSAAPGVYHVWVGSYQADEQARARLNFTRSPGAK